MNLWDNWQSFLSEFHLWCQDCNACWRAEITTATCNITLYMDRELHHDNVISGCGIDMILFDGYSTHASIDYMSWHGYGWCIMHCLLHGLLLMAFLYRHWYVIAWLAEDWSWNTWGSRATCQVGFCLMYYFHINTVLW